MVPDLQAVFQQHGLQKFSEEQGMEILLVFVMKQHDKKIQFCTDECPSVYRVQVLRDHNLTCYSWQKFNKSSLLTDVTG